MKIEKGKLYYCINNVVTNDDKKIKFKRGKVYLSEQHVCLTNETGNTRHVVSHNQHLNIKEYFSDKIAVYCHTKQDWEYIASKGYKLTSRFHHSSNYGLYSNTYECSSSNYHTITIEEFKKFYPEQSVETRVSFKKIVDLTPVNDDLLNNYGDEIKSYLDDQKVFNPQPHYDNSKGSLYKVATERNWNAYLFDVVKRLERGGKKDPLRQEIEKSIDVLKIWLNELD